MPITAFTWGYSGWGNHTRQLVEAVDAVEGSRGFEPPMFVDIRIRRTVRAVGFNGPAFERLLGEQRYRWMKSLGNTSIVTGRGHHEIADPKAAEQLLDLAIQSAEQERRVIFFCACPWPRTERPCHRSTVARLVLKAAKQRGIRVEIVEWPGGEPKQISLAVTPRDLAAVRKGRVTIPLASRSIWPSSRGYLHAPSRRSAPAPSSCIGSWGQRSGRGTDGPCRFSFVPMTRPSARPSARSRLRGCGGTTGSSPAQPDSTDPSGVR